MRDHPVERFYREAKLFELGDGTQEVLRLLISRLANREAEAGSTARLP
jgi:alkylation response protein AidB-like acyl-CoA dehydrogenase